MPSATDILFPVSALRHLFGGGGDPTGFTNMGGSPNTTGYAAEGIDKSQDSLTQALRSLTNLLGSQGPGAIQSGKEGYATGQNTLAGAIPTLKGSLAGLAAPEQYYNRLLSGDKAEMEAAVAPETTSILDQYRGKRSQMAKLGPRSGGTNEALAGSQFAQAGDVARTLQGARPAAAQGATQVAGQRADVGKGIANIGQAQAGLGLSESGQGIQALQEALQGLLARRGQNMGPGSFANQFQQYASVLI